MFQVAFCDDSDLQRELFAEQLNKYKSDRKAPFIYSIYGSSKELLNDTARLGYFDLYILDLIMPDCSGMDVAKTLRKNGYKGLIIFITSTKDYLLESYDVKAFNYLLKPIDTNKLYEVLDDSINTMAQANIRSVIARTKDGEKRIVMNSILYIDKVNRSLNFHLTNKRLVECITLRTSFEEAVNVIVDNKQFILCGTSLVINVEQLWEVATDSIKFRNGLELFPPLSSIPMISQAFKDFWKVDRQKA